MPSSEPTAAAGVQGAKPSTTNQPGEGSAPFEPAGADILRAAGVPEEAVKAFESSTEQEAAPPVAEQPKEEAEQEQPELPVAEEQPPEQETAEGEEKPTAEQDKEVAEPEAEATGDETTEPAAEGEPSEEPEEEAQPAWVQKRLAKAARQKERLQDKIDELEDRLKQVETAGAPAAAQAQGQDAWTAMDNMTDLERTVEIHRQVRDWCLKNPDGAVLNEGKPEERVMTPEQIRDELVKSLHILEAAPKKAQEIQQREQMRAFAQSEWPELFDEKNEIYATSQQFLKQYPAIASSPNRDMILGLMVEGWKPFKARIDARLKQNQNGAPPAASGKLPEALTRKIPPIPKTSAPNPPRGSRVPSPIKNAAAAVQRVAQEGATPESVMDALAALDAQKAVLGGTRRTAAPV
jgi:nicotinate-nucleotide--dimethylbenzimidazole phosphoribosyltransferase